MRRSSRSRISLRPPHRLNQGAATMIRTRSASSAGTSNLTRSIKNFSRHSCHRLCIFRSRGSGDGGRLTGVLAMIDAEASAVRPGQQAVLSRLLEIVLIELLRTPEMLPGQQRGMLTGLTDPQIASALRAFHADIRRSWSVASLAAEARMSRSVFSQRFTSLVGQPPMTYALHWRMAVACDALRFSGRSLDEIALAAGYGSASAFSTAFTRTVGRPPVRFARDSGGVRSEG